jgi:aminoglycoside phosphotransferase (APT) family kinase protein
MISKASGLELGKVLKKDDEDGMLESYVILAATWLAKLHSISNLTYRNIYSMQMEEEKLNEWSQHLGWLYPDFAKKIHNILSLILDTERSLDPKRFVIIHGDFNPNNIFVDGNDLTVIDFEDSYIFDPAKDLGYFLAKLLQVKRKYSLSMNMDALQKHFLDKYAAGMSAAEMSTEHLERVDLYKARSHLGHLHHRYWARPPRIKSHKPDAIDCEYWVNKAEECLENLL